MSRRHHSRKRENQEAMSKMTTEKKSKKSYQVIADGAADKKKKVNKILKDPTAFRRHSQVLNDALTSNPLYNNPKEPNDYGNDSSATEAVSSADSASVCGDNGSDNTSVSEDDRGLSGDDEGSDHDGEDRGADGRKEVYRKDSLGLNFATKWSESNEMDSLRKELDKKTKELDSIRKEFESKCDEIDTLKKELELATSENEKLISQVNAVLKRNATLQDLLVDRTSVSTPVESFQIKKQANTIHKSFESKNKDHSASRSSLSYGKNIVSNTVSPAREGPAPKEMLPKNNSSSSGCVAKNENLTMSGNKKKKNKKGLDMEDEHLTEACEIVLRHLKKEKPLHTDPEGNTEIGPIKVNLKKFEENFNTNHIDVDKVAKNLTQMVWTSEERAQRSLEGGQSNRFPNRLPKMPASPTKVHTILGATKAHFLNLGEPDGPMMVQLLKTARRAIGAKLAQDAYSSKAEK